MTFKNVLLAGAALTLATAAVTTGAQASNLLINGSFETGDLTGWTSTYGSYNPFGTTYGSGMDGTYWHWLAGYETPITTYQNVSGLTSGQSYVLTFIMASEFTHADSVNVSVNGGSGTLFTAPAYIPGGFNGGFWDNWVSQTYTFTAGPGVNKIQFSTVGLNQGGYDVGVDNVVLSAGGIPEPASWAMMLVGFGLAGAALRRRKVVAA